MTSFTTELGSLPPSLLCEAPRPALRVLHVLEATLGGTLRYIENLMEALAPLSIPTGFAYGISRADHRLEPALGRARQLGWQLYEIPMQRPVQPLADAAALLALRRAMQAFQPTLVHCHSSKAGALGRVAGKTLRSLNPRPRLVYSPHALAPSAHYLRIEKMLCGLTDRFLAVSASEEEQLRLLGLRTPEEAGIVYPTIDGSFFHPADRADARTALGLPHAPRLLVGIGRMTEQKRPLDYLDVLARVRTQVPGCLGIWVGDGELRNAFTARAVQLGLQDVVQVTGWVPDVRPYIAASDVVLSTSAFESFGYNLAEALAMERPGVGSRVCGTVDVLDVFDSTSASGPARPHSDVLFRVGDAADAAGCVVPLLESPALAQELGRQGREKVLRCFSSEAMRRDLVRFYNSALPSRVQEVSA